MFTDMVGSTAAAQTNEADALKLRDEQEKIVRPLLTLHLGRQVKSMGDGFLVVFDSALRAVECAVDIQDHLQARNSRPGVVPIRLRVGVHLGDVEVRAGDILGDSVNVASRIEPLAEPGGICISESVFVQVQNKIINRFEKLEQKELKGLLFPVKVYRVHLAPALRGSSSAGTILGRLDKNRIVVLPFVSMSSDPNDGYFADGLTEELITSLSLVKGLKVIARTSAMSYKNKEKHVSEIGKELSVGTVVEGSVRRAASRVRVTVQVIDVATEEHLWAEKYDRDLDDIFAVQSAIADSVARSLPGSLPTEKPVVPTLEGTEDPQAYMLFLQGQSLMYEREEGPLRQSLGFFEQAIERDPVFSRVYVGMARCYCQLGNYGLIPFSEGIERGKAAVQKALAMSPDLAEAHWVLALLSYMADDLVATEAEARKALQLKPNLAEGYGMLSDLEAERGNLRDAVSNMEAAYQLDPLSPLVTMRIGRFYFYAGREQEALEHWKKTVNINPIGTYRSMTDYYMTKGDLEKAESIVQELERIAPTNMYTLLNRGYLAALKGDKPTAMRTIAKLGTHEQGNATSSLAGYIYLAMGDVDKFFEYMFAAAKGHYLDTIDLMYSPLFAEVRKDPRLKQIVESVGSTLPTTQQELSLIMHRPS